MARVGKSGRQMDRQASQSGEWFWLTGWQVGRKADKVWSWKTLGEILGNGHGCINSCICQHVFHVTYVALFWLG